MACSVLLDLSGATPMSGHGAVVEPDDVLISQNEYPPSVSEIPTIIGSPASTTGIWKLISAS